MQQFELIKIHYYKMRNYKINLLVEYLTLLFGFFIQFSLWNSIISDSLTINNYDFKKMIFYILLARCINLVVKNNIDREISNNINTGNIINFLIKPINIFKYHLTESFGKFIFNFLCFLLPALIFISFYIQLTILDILFFTTCLILSFLIVSCINFLVGLISIKFKNIDALFWTKVFLINILSGILIPIDLFPKNISNVISALPFKYITYVPIKILTENYDLNFLLKTISEQLIWTVLLLFCVSIAQRFSFKYIDIQGG